MKKLPKIFSNSTTETFEKQYNDNKLSILNLIE